MLDDRTARLDEVPGAITERVYEELRALARHHRQRGSPMETTSIVHEAYARLVRRDPDSWDSREHFFAVAAMAMRQVIATEARRRRSQKRGGDWDRISLSGISDREPAWSRVDVVALDDALAQLAELDARMTRVVELRFFAGLTSAEIGGLLDVSSKTVDRDWRAARAWLSSRLATDDVDGS